ncbi:hypothetical protein ATANTOWER_012726 [Ataeniobius toweri]|uniref:Uncharacterized protein n=1 Tax=Ataeniobius toweri TaxID=208326 RepID=A0ABU7AES8_9TELE|nr:hypothetical protein [Ataeniobius toweri]
MAGALLRNCGTSILRLMLHVEWSCGSQPWILNPSASESLPALQQIAETSLPDSLDPWISDTQIVPETLPRSLPPGDTKPEDRTPTT